LAESKAVETTVSQIRRTAYQDLLFQEFCPIVPVGEYYGPERLGFYGINELGRRM
jgi:hypothetical protein